MGRTKSAKLGSLVEKFNLEVLRSGKNWEDRQITTEDVNRPGLQLTGFFDYFGEERLQVIGLVETSYLEGRTAQERRDAFDQLFKKFSDSILIVSYSSNSLPTQDEMVAIMAKHKKHVEVVPVDYRYSFGNQSGARTNRNKVQEYLFLGY